MEAVVPVPLITFETICALYGETFAKTFFRPVSAITKAG